MRDAFNRQNRFERDPMWRCTVEKHGHGSAAASSSVVRPTSAPQLLSRTLRSATVRHRAPRKEASIYLHTPPH
jgi:hypothetical protein